MAVYGQVLTGFLADQAQQRDFRLFWASLPLIGALLLGAVILAWVKQWRQRSSRPLLTSSDQLAHFRTLYEQGELSEEEFAQVRASLGLRMKKELKASSSPSPPPTPTQTTSQPAVQPPSGNGQAPPLPEQPPNGGPPAP